MAARFGRKCIYVILLTTISLLEIKFYIQYKSITQNMLKNKATTFLSSEQQFLHSHKNYKRQIIVWSRTRSGSTFLGELLVNRKVLYYFEPIATLWPSFWESSANSTTTTFNVSKAAEFLRDIFLCNFQQYPEYMKKWVLQQMIHLQNPLVVDICSEEKDLYCEGIEVMTPLCKASNILLAKLVRLHIRHTFELLQIPPVHPNSLWEELKSSNSTMIEKDHKFRVMNSKLISENINMNLDQSNSLLDEAQESLISSENNFTEALLKLKYLKYSSAKQSVLQKKHKGHASTSQSKDTDSSHVSGGPLTDEKHSEVSNMTSKTTNLDIKILHLVRDPRGTLNSRRRNPTSTEWENNAHAHCGELRDELKEAAELKRSYPTRYRLVRYEWLVLDVERTSRDLYGWLDLPFTIQVANFIDTHTKGVFVDSPIKSPFSTFRNSSRNAFRWRETLDFKEMLRIQRDCKDVIVALGYRLYHNLEDYLNPLLSPMLPKTFLDS